MNRRLCRLLERDPEKPQQRQQSGDFEIRGVAPGATTEKNPLTRNGK